MDNPIDNPMDFDESKLSDESKANLAKTKDLCLKIIESEASMPIQALLGQQISMMLTTSIELGDKFKDVAVAARSTFTGSPEQVREKCNDFLALMEHIIMGSFNATKELMLSEDKAWDLQIPNMRRILTRADELIAEGVDIMKAVQQSIDETELPEKLKAGLKRRLTELHAARRKRASKVLKDLGDEDTEDEPEKDEFGCDVEYYKKHLTDGLKDNISVFWLGVPKSSLPASMFGEDALQVLEHTPSEDNPGGIANLLTAIFTGWEDKPMSDIAKGVNAIARDVFDRDGYHSPMFVVSVNKDEDGNPRKGVALLTTDVGMRTNISKDAFSMVVKDVVKKYDSDIVIMISECWVWKSGVPPEMFETLLDKFKSGERPPEETKREAVTITLTSKWGDTIFIHNFIVRDEGKPVRLELPDMQESKDKDKPQKVPAEGRFSGFWD